MIAPWSFLSRFRSQQRAGCDFGTDTFKLVQLAKVGERYVLKACGMTGIDWVADQEAAVRRVQVFLREHQVDVKRAAMNLSHPNLQVQEMELAKMPDRDLKMAIRWNMREKIEGPLELYQVAYTPISKSPDGQRQLIMAYGITSEVIKEHQDRAAKLGLNLLAIEPDVSALMAALDYNLDWTEGERIGLLDLGYGGGNFLIAVDRVLQYARPLPHTGLNRLAEAADPTAVTVEARREVVRTILAGEQQTDGAQRNTDDFYRQVLLEIGRVIDNYSGQSGLEVGQGIHRLYLCGGGASYPRLATYLEKNLGVPTAIFDPLRKIEGAPSNLAERPIYAVAVGLAIPQES